MKTTKIQKKDSTNSYHLKPFFEKKRGDISLSQLGKPNNPFFNSLNKLKDKTEKVYKEDIKPFAGFGGEVTNESDIPWSISGKNDKTGKPFFFNLRPNQNSDDIKGVKKNVNGDIDAIWPNGKTVNANKEKTTIYNAHGAFKVEDFDNANITGNKDEGYEVTDYYKYIKNPSSEFGYSFNKGNSPKLSKNEQVDINPPKSIKDKYVDIEKKIRDEIKRAEILRTSVNKQPVIRATTKSELQQQLNSLIYYRGVMRNTIMRTSLTRNVTPNQFRLGVIIDIDKQINKLQSDIERMP